ncbi:hypothetical protein C0Q70_00456 [Pomacea canaliculata]|uniref:Uncharacterized protein n=1 Tax=Pomacea canaliculata TaxID=400727 RepID=A0A2T7PWP9_POMCA|nr:hypothetical protein C0Q70_00456 [Pomacea canaliculata]
MIMMTILLLTGVRCTRLPLSTVFTVAPRVQRSRTDRSAPLDPLRRHHSAADVGQEAISLELVTIYNLSRAAFRELYSPHID